MATAVDQTLNLARTMRRHYFYSFMSGLLLLLAIVGIFALVTTSQFRAKTMSELATRGEQLHIALNQNLDVVQSHVSVMSHSMSIHLEQPSMATVSSLQFLNRQSLNAPADAPWENLPDNLKSIVGSLNINPSVSESTELFRRDLAAAVSMMPAVASEHARHQYIAWSYYYDANQAWELIYPAQSRADLLASTGTTSMSAAFKEIFAADGTYPLELAGKKNNPDRRQIWTAPYLDVSGKGMMITLLDPVYLHDQLVGVVGADVTLHLFQTTLSAYPLTLGRAVIIDSQGDILADSAGALNSATGKLTLSDIMPDVPLHNLLRENAGMASTDPEWMIFPLRDTKWRLVLHLPTSDIDHLLLTGLRPYLILVASFLVALVALALMQSRAYTQPALRLAEFVDEMALDTARAIPRVPPVWRHWFERVANTARDRDKYLQETLQYASELEGKVLSRTVELQTMNRNLEQAMTQLRNAQKQVVQNEKLASLGFLVAGIAHEMNTPIGTSLLAATTLYANTKAFSEQAERRLSRKELNEFIAYTLEGTLLMEKNMTKAADLIRSFKQISVDRVTEDRHEFQLAALGADIKNSIEPVLTENNLKLEIDIPDDITMTSFPDSLAQVMMSLVNNAITHAFVSSRSGIIICTAKADGNDIVRITVSDNGCGMREDIADRVFDPFVTTDLGKGRNGLGMHIVYNVVTKILGGKIEVNTVVGAGTMWILNLPRSVQ